ncbi:secretagogin-like [Lytechinus variegatus]|uniref:secretagogin-like n=1 Tax=Lytechinus variegatus TaxID=7654 RepID=UPI001BB1962A|nr:secretagogin-like [Lytechinus variegatus]
MIKDLKSCYMGAYDESQDGRFHVSELADLLPTDENFLLIFRKNENITDSRALLKLWKKYDTNSSGFIERSQLKSFIRDLCSGKKEVDDKKLDEYAAATLKLCDRNNDGRLGLREMTRLLNIKQESNFLNQFDERVKNMTEKEKIRHINRVFHHYAQDGCNEIEGEQLDAFISDLMDTDSKMDMSQLEISKRAILHNFDCNRDGKINLEELAMCLNCYKFS